MSVTIFFSFSCFINLVNNKQKFVCRQIEKLSLAWFIFRRKYASSAYFTYRPVPGRRQNETNNTTQIILDIAI
jgi:hypothetical protein